MQHNESRRCGKSNLAVVGHRPFGFQWNRAGFNAIISAGLLCFFVVMEETPDDLGHN
jgi:hypothetical protein